MSQSTIGYNDELEWFSKNT